MKAPDAVKFMSYIPLVPPACHAKLAVPLPAVIPDPFIVPEPAYACTITFPALSPLAYNSVRFIGMSLPTDAPPYG